MKAIFSPSVRLKVLLEELIEYDAESLICVNNGCSKIYFIVKIVQIGYSFYS